MPLSETAIILHREGMGVADGLLPRKLLSTYLSLLLENDTLPGVICFYTDAVKLACEGSEFLETLAALEQKGVHLILCKTCLDSFGIADKVRVGIIGGMGDILAAQAKAGKVITL